MIVAAAIRVGKMTISAPPPARHGDLIKLFHDVNRKIMVRPSEQGFLTSEGRFVDRYEARDIAKMAGQRKRATGPEGMLFSEDLW